MDLELYNEEIRELWGKVNRNHELLKNGKEEEQKLESLLNDIRFLQKEKDLLKSARILLGENVFFSIVLTFFINLGFSGIPIIFWVCLLFVMKFLCDHCKSAKNLKMRMNQIVSEIYPQLNTDQTSSEVLKNLDFYFAQIAKQLRLQVKENNLIHQEYFQQKVLLSQKIDEYSVFKVEQPTLTGLRSIPRDVVLSQDELMDSVRYSDEKIRVKKR